MPARCLHFSLCFRFSAGSGDGLTRTVPLVLSFHVVAGRNEKTTESCGHDGGGVCVVEPEEPVDKPRTTIGTSFSVLHCIRLPSLMSCGF